MDPRNHPLGCATPPQQPAATRYVVMTPPHSPGPPTPTSPPLPSHIPLLPPPPPRVQLDDLNLGLLHSERRAMERAMDEVANQLAAQMMEDMESQEQHGHVHHHRAPAAPPAQAPAAQHSPTRARHGRRAGPGLDEAGAKEAPRVVRRGVSEPARGGVGAAGAKKKVVMDASGGARGGRGEAAAARVPPPQTSGYALPPQDHHQGYDGAHPNQAYKQQQQQMMMYAQQQQYLQQQQQMMYQQQQQQMMYQQQLRQQQQQQQQQQVPPHRDHLPQAAYQPSPPPPVMMPTDPDGGSYAAQLAQQRQGPIPLPQRVITPNLDVHWGATQEGWEKLGKLGPDLDEARLEEARAKREKALEFAKNARNRANHAPKPLKANLIRNPDAEEAARRKELYRKKKEFAKKVTQNKLGLAFAEALGGVGGDLSMASKSPRKMAQAVEKAIEARDPGMLELEARHDAEAARVEAIRRELEYLG